MKHASSAKPPNPASPGPLGTLNFLGPNEALATKAVGAVFQPPQVEPVAVEEWVSTGADVRFDPVLVARIAAFFKQHGATQVGMGEKVVGCPHEAGVDYPLGETCPLCPYWKNRPSARRRSPPGPPPG